MNRRLSESLTVLSVVLLIAVSMGAGGMWLVSHLTHTVSLTVVCDADAPTTVDVDGTTYVVACPGKGTYPLTVADAAGMRLVSVG